MKEASSTKKNKRSFSIRQAVTSLAVFAIVLVVPVFTLVEFGHFFRGDSANRSSTPLPVMMQRKVDATNLPPQLFKEPLITVTFDDGWQSIYESALPLLQKHGIRTTQYVLTGTADNAEYVSWDQIAQMQKAGHEIGCHTVSHVDLTTLDDATLEGELKFCKDELTKRFGPITSFASPYGASNPRTVNAIKRYFDTHRNTNGDPSNGVTDVDVNVPENFDRFNIIGFTVRHETKVSELQKLVEYAKTRNAWVVLTYHQADEGGSQFNVNPPNLDKQFAYLSKTNVRIVTMSEALRATRLQNAEF